VSSEKKRFRVAHCSFCVAPAMSSHVGSSEQQRLGAAAAYRRSAAAYRRSPAAASIASRRLLRRPLRGVGAAAAASSAAPTASSVAPSEAWLGAAGPPRASRAAERSPSPSIQQGKEAEVLVAGQTRGGARRNPRQAAQALAEPGSSGKLTSV